MMAQGLFNKTASLFKSSIAEGTLLGWVRLARFARSGKELSVFAADRLPNLGTVENMEKELPSCCFFTRVRVPKKSQRHHPSRSKQEKVATLLDD